ncbi:MAG: family 20 glycosylhydrolase [Pirellulales bacterium]|nr:family 20 glycosylhydrolase [Pirellulales bacterium]
MTIFRTTFFAAFATLSAILFAGHAAAQTPAQQPPKENPIFAPIADDPRLPRVLLIGDSISMGYTLPVRELLKGKANVHRPAENCGPTSRGVQNLDAWLGDKPWNAIHFNFGLHDLKLIDGKHQVPLADYEKNLREIVKRLKGAGAKLIWCATTPVPKKNSPPRRNEDVPAYNAAAKKIMEENGIPLDDLYAFALPRIEKIQRPDNVHFTASGSKVLAKQVAKTIIEALETSADANGVSLVPAPAALKFREGSFELNAKTFIAASPGTEAEAERLAAALRVSTGLPLPVKQEKAAADCIALELDKPLEATLGLEGYRLSVAPSGVAIQAAGEAGLFYGGITFRQLLPPEAFGKSAAKDVAWKAPCVEIADAPRFVWRGLLIDMARHYQPLEFIKKLVDAMAMQKMNVLQIHLTDDQGWRIEIKKYPRLTEVGSIRKESPLREDRNRGDGKQYGPFFYTQEQLRDLVAYAQARHVTILPEIEMPGHAVGALASYPEYSCTGGPFETKTRWAIHEDIFCVGNEKTVEFLKDVLSEAIEIFPSEFIHIGGDEAPRVRWRNCPKCQALIKEKGLKNEAQLQTYLNRRIEEFLISKGRRLLGWDEILEGGLTPGATVMSWRGMNGGIAAANAGHDVVMSPTKPCYLDFSQSRAPGEPHAIGGYNPLDSVYAFEPVPPNLPEAKRKHILGTQGNLWGEFLVTPGDVEYFGFPRAAALAEVAWSPAKDRNFANFHGRLERHLKRLDQIPIGYRKLDPLPQGNGEPKK